MILRFLGDTIDPSVLKITVWVLAVAFFAEKKVREIIYLRLIKLAKVFLMVAINLLLKATQIATQKNTQKKTTFLSKQFE